MFNYLITVFIPHCLQSPALHLQSPPPWSQLNGPHHLQIADDWLALPLSLLTGEWSTSFTASKRLACTAPLPADRCMNGPHRLQIANDWLALPLSLLTLNGPPLLIRGLTKT